ncbi:MAG: tetratricopeptide repeat protein [Bacteroidales bacterium]|nr:tetratricopeptide repeat protein [Bacteroidales bacterium]
MATNEKLGSKKTEQEEVKENFVKKTISFFTKYQNIIYGVIIGILVLACAWIAFDRFYMQKKIGEASAQIVHPIALFMAGDTASLNLALEGDDENDGFLTIASGYKLTKTANTANYYAGLCYLKLGQKDEAMTYLKKFKKKEDVMWYQCQANIGDLYDENGDEANALKYYQKAVKSEDPFFTPMTLFKIAQIFERQEKWSDAVETYKAIEDRFYTEYNRMSIAQYAEKAKIKASK